MILELIFWYINRLIDDYFVGASKRYLNLVHYV